MDKPPISLFYPSYVVEYALVDSTVTYIDRKVLNVDGKWLGKVPQLAICRDIETNEYQLAHCNEEWECLCAVELEKTIHELQKVAEKHYRGINNAGWFKTEYTEEQAVALFDEVKKESQCSFCGRSPYDSEIKSMVGDKVRICDKCIRSFYEVLDSDIS